jgi:hypothetical protein
MLRRDLDEMLQRIVLKAWLCGDRAYPADRAYVNLRTAGV